jgi:hypothetical protein
VRLFIKAIGLFQAMALLLSSGLAPAGGPRYPIGVCTETVTRAEHPSRRVEQQINVQGPMSAAASAPDQARGAS